LVMPGRERKIVVREEVYEVLNLLRNFASALLGREVSFGEVILVLLYIDYKVLGHPEKASEVLRDIERRYPDIYACMTRHAKEN